MVKNSSVFTEVKGFIFLFSVRLQQYFTMSDRRVLVISKIFCQQH